MKVGWIVENDATFVADEVRELRRIGIDVRVASVFRPEPVRWESRFAGPIDYPDSGTGAWLRYLAPACPPHPRFARLVARAHAEGVPFRLVALSLGLAAAARRERWCHVHGSFASLPAWVAGAVSELAGIPFSFTGHAYDVQRPRPFLPRLIAGSRFVRAISTETAERLRALQQEAHTDRVRVGRLGVDMSRFARVEPAAPPEILSVARLVSKKGLDTLVRAAGRLRDPSRAFRVRILGDGPERRALEALRDEQGLSERVSFEGDAAPAQVEAALARASVFALPCRHAVPGPDHDGIPVAVLEAMAAGVPVVSTPVGGIPEAIVPGVHGWLVPPDDPEALTTALATLLGRPELGKRLARAARSRIAERFQLSQSVARLAGWLREAAPSRGSPNAELVA